MNDLSLEAVEIRLRCFDDFSGLSHLSVYELLSVTNYFRPRGGIKEVLSMASSCTSKQDEQDDRDGASEREKSCATKREKKAERTNEKQQKKTNVKGRWKLDPDAALNKTKVRGPWTLEDCGHVQGPLLDGQKEDRQT